MEIVVLILNRNILLRKPEEREAEKLYIRESSVSLVDLNGEYVSSLSEQATTPARYTVK